MKRIKFLLGLLLLCNFITSAQDVVYDSIVGNKSYWRNIKVGPTEKLISTFYENQGILAKSKVLMAAGIWDGLSENVDYRLQKFNHDTITFEFKSDQALNLNLYKYYWDDTNFASFLGLRKASLGGDIFTGQYLYICPVTAGSIVYVYTGTGSKRKLYLTINANQLIDASYKDYSVLSSMTVKVIHGDHLMMHSMVNTYIPPTPTDNIADRITVWPNPTKNFLNIKIINNPGVIIRIYDQKPLLKYEDLNFVSETTKIDVTSWMSGVYFVVFVSKENGSILYTVKAVVVTKA
jgi:hypothetical protein